MPNDMYFMTRRNVSFAIGFQNIIFEQIQITKPQKMGNKRLQQASLF